MRDGLDGRIAAILDSGPCGVGIESTVLDLSGQWPRLLRPGGVTLEAIARLCGKVEVVSVADAGDIRSPGQLESHYAPGSAVRLNAVRTSPDEVLLAFGPPLAGAETIYQLSEARDVIEAASRLFDGLRWLDVAGHGKTIAVMPIPGHGAGRAINDRLRRAAAPRPG